MPVISPFGLTLHFDTLCPVPSRAFLRLSLLLYHHYPCWPVGLRRNCPFSFRTPVSLQLFTGFSHCASVGVAGK